MTPEEKDQLLDRYVAGHPMSTDEETGVQKLLRTDPDFRTEYRLRQTLLEAGIRQRRAAWEARQRTQPAPARPAAFPMRWAAAACVLLLLGLGLVWWTQQPRDPEPLMGSTALFRSNDTQLGLAGNDSSAVGRVAWVVTKGSENSYEFSQLDTLRIFATDPGQWADQTWRLMSLSEVRYRLKVGNRTYLLEQGRSVRLPLRPER